MIEPSADSAGAAELGPAGLAAAPAKSRPRRQGPITAETFRQLTARVKGGARPPPKLRDVPPVVLLEPVIVLVTQAPAEVQVEPDAPVEVEVTASIPELPVFAPLRPFTPPVAEFDVPDAEPAAEPPGEMNFEVPAPAIEVLAPVAEQPVIEAEVVTLATDAELAVEAIVESVDLVVADSPEAAAEAAANTETSAIESASEAGPAPVVAEPPAADSLAAVEIIAPRSLAPPVAPGKSDRPASAIAGRVMDAMLKSVTEAIYAKPTATERAAYLREIAELIEAERKLEPAPQPEPPPTQAIATSQPLVAVDVQNSGTLADTLAGRLGPAAPVLRKPAEDPDPFAKTAAASIRLDPRPAETPEADEESGDRALSLLDMMSAGTGSALPQERALAADTLLRLVPRVPVRQLIAVSERMAIMEHPPALLVAKLIRDSRAEVVAPLLERCMHITDKDLMTAASEGDSFKRRMIAKRRILSSVLSDHLIGFGDGSVLLTLIRNPGAAFTHEAFHRLAEQASRHPSLLAPLATRADLPAPVAFELFWFVPQELRRFIFSRFLTDSETLNKILRITMAAQEGGDTKFPSKFESAVELLKHSDASLVRSDRNVAELQSIFDTLSFNKARILLTYWDWFVQKSGPYSRHN
ncbi:MAG: DUF2336 domain-containing protein [Rhizobiales bacterium]|nr:DUF2336 domain-containing protein [Hyphomicrobiales bacterium]